jgi:hypothetical protein
MIREGVVITGGGGLRLDDDVLDMCHVRGDDGLLGLNLACFFGSSILVCFCRSPRFLAFA